MNQATEIRNRMMIREMGKEECVNLLTGVQLARLACASANQPYVVPVYLAYHQSFGEKACLYGFTTIGQKVEWMRANPLVCVEFDDTASETQWVSVIIFGRYEELPAVSTEDVRRFRELRHAEPGAVVLDAPKRTNETLFAHQLLESRAMWWEPASTARVALTHGVLARSLAPIYFKVWIDQVTGYESTRDADDGNFPARIGRPERLAWLRRALAGVRK